MSDIFHEVDEEVRREQLKKLWEKYGILVILAAVFVVAAVGGWRGYQWWDAKRAEEAGMQFEAAALLAEQGKHEEAQAAFAKIAKEGTAGYRVLARFREAAEQAGRDPKAAVALYDSIASDSSASQPLRDLAALRAGLLLIDDASLEEIVRRLEPLTGASAPFRHTARELIALSAWRVGDTAAVQRWADLVRTDPEAPASVRTRIEALLALIGQNDKSKG